MFGTECLAECGIAVCFLAADAVVDMQCSEARRMLLCTAEGMQEQKKCRGIGAA